jgi:hypothetical protein
MIKVQNNKAIREPVPAFLQGLAPESLADLSWTDPALGVSDAAWWPEENNLPALQRYERYGKETLSINETRKVVVVNREVVKFSQDEIDAITQQEQQQQLQEKASLAEQIKLLQDKLAAMEN